MQGFIIINPYNYIDTVYIHKRYTEQASIGENAKKEFIAGEKNLKRISG